MSIPGFVYFIQAIPVRARGRFDTHVESAIGEALRPDYPVKIGWSGSLHHRFRTISSKVRSHISFYGAFAGHRSDERAMHAMFEHLRINPMPFGPRGGVEWFRPAWELDFIVSLPRPRLSQAPLSFAA